MVSHLDVESSNRQVGILLTKFKSWTDTPVAYAKAASIVDISGPKESISMLMESMSKGSWGLAPRGVSSFACKTRSKPTLTMQREGGDLIVMAPAAILSDVAAGRGFLLCELLLWERGDDIIGFAFTNKIR